MNLTREYYLRTYDELSILSNTEKCVTVLMRNRDTGELVVKKTMHKSSFEVYSKLKEIQHKNIVNVLECFEDGEHCIAVEEYINGKRIDDYCAGKAISEEECIRLGINICDGLEAIHQKGIVHRDIQPKNIIISNEGTLKLIDFDISRINNINKQKDTELLGTAGYAAPEQYGFSQTSNRSDIYSVGAVLLEIFQKKEIAVSQKINKIITKCMELDPQNRYSSVVELKENLEECIEIKTIEQGKIERQTKKEEKKLPPITLKYIISTIPGFRRKKILHVIFAVFWYVVFLWSFGAVAFEYKHISIYNRIIGAILSEMSFIIPYMYLMNIAHIAERVPRKVFYSKAQQWRYQIGMSVVIFIALVICISFVLPLDG